MTNNIEQAFIILQEKCKEIGYGKWKIELLIHQGRCIGFEELSAPLRQFREVWKNKEEK